MIQVQTLLSLMVLRIVTPSLMYNRCSLDLNSKKEKLKIGAKLLFMLQKKQRPRVQEAPIHRLRAGSMFFCAVGAYAPMFRNEFPLTNKVGFHYMVACLLLCFNVA